MNNNLKQIIRSFLSPVLYFFYYKWVKKSYEISRNGKPLKHGITAVVAAKNEDYTIPLCLKSLIGIADQIICIDNGSEDH